MNIELDKKKRI